MFVSIYVSIWLRVAFVASMFPRTRLFNQQHVAHVHIRRQRPLLRNDEKAATKNENQIDNCKPGQLLVQGLLAVLTESVYKLELHAATASVRRCAVALQR